MLIMNKYLFVGLKEEETQPQRKCVAFGECTCPWVRIPVYKYTYKRKLEF